MTRRLGALTQPKKGEGGTSSDDKERDQTRDPSANPAALLVGGKSVLSVLCSHENLKKSFDKLAGTIDAYFQSCMFFTKPSCRPNTAVPGLLAIGARIGDSLPMWWAAPVAFL